MNGQNNNGQEPSKQIYRRAAAPGEPPRSAAKPPRQPRPQPPKKAPKKGRPQPARRQAQQRLRLLAIIGLAVLALVICLIVWLVTRFSGPKAPAELDIGAAGAAWDKNENGFYFNDEGAVILPAVKKGIDVSRHQGEVDWKMAKAAGIDFAILRCGFGGEWTDDSPTYNQDDVQWRRNADACTELGIPFGTYLYSYAITEEDARSEADHVARLLGLCEPPREGLEDYTDTPYQLSYPVYYDLEDSSISGLFPDESAALAAAFFDQLESYGYKGEEGIYASLNWVRGRLQDPGFDRWRDNFWIARYAPELGYTGPYSMWQSTYTELGERYGVQSETVDVDFVMENLSFTGIENTKGDPVPTFTNDTFEDALWLPGAKARAALVTEQVEDAEGKPQRVFWASSDETVATVDRKGIVHAQGDGVCTVTATLADGRQTAECTVRVGDVTVPVFATGALQGACGADESVLTLADVSALRASTENCILLDAGGSVQGSAQTSLTGGLDMTTALGYAGYDLQAAGGADLAFGVSRLSRDITAAAGPTLAANLRGQDGVALFHRATSWNRNRITNGMNYLVQRAGHTVGFFALAGAGQEFAPFAVTNEDAPAADDLVRTAGEQAAALKAEGAEAIVCVLAPPFSDESRQTLLPALKELGVTAVIDGSLDEAEDTLGDLPILPAATGADRVGRLDITFTADGKVKAAVTAVSAETLLAARETMDDDRRSTYDNMLEALQYLADNDAGTRDSTLFTLAENEDAKKGTVSFGNYVAEVWEKLAEDDRDAWGAQAGEAELFALAGGVGELEEGDITHGMLLDALPAGERLQLVLTTRGAVEQLLQSDAVAQTYLDSLVKFDAADAEAPALLITDTGTLAQLDGQEITLLRDYGDAYWSIRMDINDQTDAFEQPFQLPEKPQMGAGRGK